MVSFSASFWWWAFIPRAILVQVWCHLSMEDYWWGKCMRFSLIDSRQDDGSCKKKSRQPQQICRLFCTERNTPILSRVEWCGICCLKVIAVDTHVYFGQNDINTLEKLFSYSKASRIGNFGASLPRKEWNIFGDTVWQKEHTFLILFQDCILIMISFWSTERLSHHWLRLINNNFTQHLLQHVCSWSTTGHHDGDAECPV